MRRKQTIEKRIWFCYQRWQESKISGDGHEGTHYAIMMALKWALGSEFDADGYEIKTYRTAAEHQE